MKRIASIIIILLLSVQAFSQHKEKRERIHTIKVGFLTDRLDLTSKEAQGFWPIYNSYEKEARELWHSYKEKYPDQFGKARDRYVNKADQKKTEQQLEGELQFREQKLELRRKYKKQFLTVISATQVAELYQAEADFREMLIKQVRHDKGNGPKGRH